MENGYSGMDSYLSYNYTGVSVIWQAAEQSESHAIENFGDHRSSGSGDGHGAHAFASEVVQQLAKE
jgi:hypothetical protein